MSGSTCAPIDVRPARADEAEALAAAYDWLFAPPDGPAPAGDRDRAAADLRALVAAPDTTAFVAAQDSELVGFCTVPLDIRSVRFGQRAWVEDLAVHPDRRSLGAGKALLDAAKA